MAVSDIPTMAVSDIPTRLPTLHPALAWMLPRL